MSSRFSPRRRCARARFRRLSIAVGGGVAASILTPALCRAVDATWNVDADGPWSVAANWTSNPSVPNGIGDTARFLNVITTNHTIAQDIAGLTLGVMEFDDDNSYTIAGPNDITLDVPSGMATVTVNNSNGNASHTIATNLVLNETVEVVTNANAATPLTFSGTIVGGGGLLKRGPGHLVLTGSSANTFADTAAVTAGTLELFKTASSTPAIGGSLVVGEFEGMPNTAIAITKNGGVPDGANVIVRRTGQFQVPSGEVIDQLVLNGGSATIAGDGPSLRVNGLSSQGDANTATISGPGNLILQNVTVEVVNGTPANDLVISAPVTGLGFTKIGEGTLVLTGNNTYGTTTISNGTLQIGNGGFSGTLGQGSIINNGVLAFHRGGAGVTVSQAITGSGGSVHVINGAATFTGNNTYTGTTTVSAGLLQIGEGGTTGTLGAGDVITAAGGAVAFNRSDNITIAHNISGSGSVQHFGNGTTNLTGSITVTGPVGSSAGRMILNNSLLDCSVFGNGNGALELASNGSSTRVIRMRSLTMSGTARLDLRDNKAIITQMPLGTASGGVYTGISRMIQTGSNAGAWNGTGITTSMPVAATGLTALGVATAEQTGHAGGTWGGVSVIGTDVLVMYTYGGDANLDGFVSGDDYTAIDFNILVPGAFGWSNGDFNYDGIISGDDYTVIDFNILAQGAPFPTSSTSAGATLVPEPYACGFASLAATLMLASRHRRPRGKFSDTSRIGGRRRGPAGE